MLAPLLFPWPRSGHPTNSRIATVELLDWAFQLRVHLRSLQTDVYFENGFTKPYHMGHPPFHCSAVITT